MSEKFGMINMEEASPQTAAQVEAEVHEMVERSYDRVLKLLRSNRDKLDKIAFALLEHETLTGRELRDVVEGRPIRTRNSPTRGHMQY